MRTHGSASRWLDGGRPRTQIEYLLYRDSEILGKIQK